MTAENKDLYATIKKQNVALNNAQDALNNCQELLKNLGMRGFAEVCQGANGIALVLISQALAEGRAALLQSTALPAAELPVGELTDSDIRKIWSDICAEWADKGGNPYLKYARTILAAARSQPVREPLPIERLREIERNQVYNNTATLIDFARAIEAAHGITKKGAQ